MTRQEMATRAQELKELMAMREELEAEIATLQDQFKAFMLVDKSDTVQAGAYKVTWKPVTSARLDSKALKQAAPELVQRFTKETTTRRFVLA